MANKRWEIVWKSNDNTVAIYFNGEDFSIEIYGPEDPNCNYSWSYNKVFDLEEISELTKSLIPIILKGVNNGD